MQPRTTEAPAAPVDLAHLLDLVGDGVLAVGGDAIIRYANSAVADLLGWAREDLVGAGVASIVPPSLREAHRSAFDRFQQTGEAPLLGRPVRMPALRADGREIEVELRLDAWCDGGAGERGVLAVLRPIGERDEGERQTELAMHLLRVLAESRTLREGAAKILEAIAGTLGWDLGVLWVVDRPARVLRPVEVWHASAVVPGAFVERTRQLALRPGTGLPGRVWLDRQPLWVEDARSDGPIDRAAAAAAAGLRSQLAFPIVAGSEVIGVVELLSVGPRPLDPVLLAATHSIGRPLGEFVDRLRVEEELRFQEAVLESQNEATIDGILVVAVDGTIISSNRRFAEMWAIPDEVIASRSDDAALAAVREQLVDPDAFLARVAYLYEHPDEPSLDEIRLLDGRTLERWSAPLPRDDGGYYGRAWYFRDVTEQRRAHHELARGRARASFLAEASAVLSASLDVERTLQRVAELAVPGLADWCLVHGPGPDGSIRPVASVSTRPDQAKELLELRMRADGGSPHDGRHGIAAVLAGGGPILYREIGEDLLRAVARDDDHLAALRLAGFRSAMLVPMVARGEVTGVITFASAESGRSYTEADLELAEELGRRAALAVDNALLYGAQADVARVLQQSLLPTTLPEISGFQLAACYHTSVEGSDVGGDFYDVFEAGDGEWGIVVGDVCGKGPRAASMTALARHTVRTAAMHRRRPASVLRVVNDAVLREAEDDRFCTIVYGRLRAVPGGAEVTLASGGHPLPLVLRAGGDVEPAARPGSALGLFPDPTLPERRLRLGPGDALVLYTDGVVEARSGAEFFGDERLVEAVRACRGLSARETVAMLEAEALSWGGGPVSDDIAILVVRVPE